MSSETRVYPDLAARLTALGSLAVGLGSAIQGIADTTDRDNSVSLLIKHLDYVTQRLAFLERATDPHANDWDQMLISKGKSRNRMQEDQ